MAKQTLFPAFATTLAATPAAALAAALLLLLSACSSAPPPAQAPKEEPMTYPSSAALVPAKKLWTRKVPGLLTDLNLSRDGSTVLVATVPDHDSLDPQANHSEHYVTFYSRDGRVLSRTAMPAQVKAQSLSDDGSFAVIATYDDQIRGMSRDGKELWTAEATCQPFVLGGPGSPPGAPKRILCFHDDDAEPDVGFEVFDWEGKRLAAFPIRDDALGLKISPDERSFVLALTHGRVLVFNSAFRAGEGPIARQKVAGEIVDVAVSSMRRGRGGARPGFAVLYSHGFHAKLLQRLELFGAPGKARRRIPVSEPAEAIALAPRGGAVFGYSNTNSGQVLARFSGNPREAWRRKDGKTAEYTSRVVATAGGVWVGFQDAHVLGFDNQGGLKTDIRAPAEEGAFLYGFAVSSSAHSVVVGMDDGSLSLFQTE